MSIPKLINFLDSFAEMLSSEHIKARWEPRNLSRERSSDRFPNDFVEFIPNVEYHFFLSPDERNSWIYLEEFKGRVDEYSLTCYRTQILRFTLEEFDGSIKINELLKKMMEILKNHIEIHINKYHMYLDRDEGRFNQISYLLEKNSK